MICPNGDTPIRLDQLVPDVVLSDLENRRIDFSLLQIDKELAKGGFGIVYKVFTCFCTFLRYIIHITLSQGKYNQQVVAVKKLIVEQAEEGEDDTTSKVFGEFRREVWVMRYEKYNSIKSIVLTFLLSVG